ncbi:MAG TPA: tetratricopeptide repeat protein [Candidatus Acidoferrales bacterium]|nr:tetratricopeptide repeat protein [Candidatus Acidoferrales bacterium]
MRTLRGAILAGIVLLAASFAATEARSAGSKYFDDADRGLINGLAADAAVSAEKGWAAVRAAGPADPGFLEGVHTASRIYAVLGRDLRAEAVYAEAAALCDTPRLQVVGLRIQYMLADYLIRNSEYVKAESVLRSSLAIENRSAHKSPLYTAFLQSLAFVREQEGDLSEAEDLYRTTLNSPPPDLSEVVIQRFYSSPGPRLAFVGEPRSSMAAFYSNHGRITDAEALYNDRLAQTSLNQEERLGVMQQLAGFLSLHGSATEALAIEERIVRFREAQALAAPDSSGLLTNELITLANLEVAAGRSEDARVLLATALQHAEQKHGTNSPEYRSALNYLFENRRSAGDYDAAERLARERLQLAQTVETSDKFALPSALLSLSYLRREQGHVEEADALLKRGIDANRAAFPHLQPPSVDQFAHAEALVRAGKPAEAVRVAQEIADSATGRDNGEQFGFRHLAQSMAGDHNPEASQVASIALSLRERRHSPDDTRFTGELTDWANFYRGFLGQPDRARDLLLRAETAVRACCGAMSRKMEPVLQERAWLAGATGGPAASIAYLEQLRELRASTYGANSEQVEQGTRDLAAANAQAGRWPDAAKLYLKTIDISTRRTWAFGYEHVQLLDSIAMHFVHHGDAHAALELNQRALDRAAGSIAPMSCSRVSGSTGRKSVPCRSLRRRPDRRRVFPAAAGNDPQALSDSNDPRLTYSLSSYRIPPYGSAARNARHAGAPDAAGRLPSRLRNRQNHSQHLQRGPRD